MQKSPPSSLPFVFILYCVFFAAYCFANEMEGKCTHEAKKVTIEELTGIVDTLLNFREPHISSVCCIEIVGELYVSINDFVAVQNSG